jgi:anthranilate synthase/aminodeoxychorismate synthase-like glutamine amidotransferase
MALVLIDNYDSFTYNLFQMLQVLTTQPVEVFRNDKLDFDSLKSLKPTHVVLSPGPGHPGNDSDFGICKDIIINQEQLSCPVLGVCLGHQGIVHHLGGKVVGAPKIVHGKSSRVNLTDRSPLFEGLQSGFEAMRYHSLVAAEEKFPSDLAVTAREADDGLIMALQHKTKALYGVQFHPESIGTPEGSKILRNFIEKC